jgi:hypothetical protein
MKPETIATMLRSGQSARVENAIGYLKRWLRTNPWPDEVWPAVIALCEAEGPWPARLSDLVMNFPLEPALDHYERLVQAGSFDEQAMGLQRVSLWLEALPQQRARLHGMVSSLARGGATPWVRFLAALSEGRDFSDASAWRRAASALVEAESEGREGSIRSEADELLSRDERALVDRELEAMGAPRLVTTRRQPTTEELKGLVLRWSGRKPEGGADT